LPQSKLTTCRDTGRRCHGSLRTVHGLECGVALPQITVDADLWCLRQKGSQRGCWSTPVVDLTRCRRVQDPDGSGRTGSPCRTNVTRLRSHASPECRMNLGGLQESLRHSAEYPCCIAVASAVPSIAISGSP